MSTGPALKQNRKAYSQTKTPHVTFPAYSTLGTLLRKKKKENSKGNVGLIEVLEIIIVFFFTYIAQRNEIQQAKTASSNEQRVSTF